MEQIVLLVNYMLQRYNLGVDKPWSIHSSLIANILNRAHLKNAKSE